MYVIEIYKNGSQDTWRYAYHIPYIALINILYALLLLPDPGTADNWGDKHQ